MGHVPLLDELAIVAVLAATVTVLLSKLELPTVAGLLAAGALLGPHGFRLARSVDSIEELAEVGVVLLLFSIGLEFTLARLRDIFRRVALGAALQVAFTTVAAACVARALGEPSGRALFYGFAFALSSTAIVLRTLGERRELDSPHGRFIVGTLIFQDLCVVPMVLVVPLLGDGAAGDDAASMVGIAMAKAALVVAGALAGARFVVPKVLGWVDATRSREVFLLAILGLCIGTAWLTSLAGLSLALGAFLGGMVVADTEYGHRAMGDILPLRDAFVSVFFVSLGMLFDVRIVAAEPVRVGALLAGFVLAKGALAALAAMAMRSPARVAWLAGVGLAQFGEFGFVLTRLAESHGVIDRDASRPLLAAGILSMFLTPLVVRRAPHVRIGERILEPLERLIGVAQSDDTPHPPPLEGHVLIVGFGLAGRFAARALRECGVPFVVLEVHAAHVHRGRELGMPIAYGDAASESTLRHHRVEHARLVVLLMNDPHAAERVVDTLRRVAPHTRVLVRTHFVVERDLLVGLGALDVVAEEVEGALEIISRMLRAMEVPRNQIDACIDDVRTEAQPSERPASVRESRVRDIHPLGAMRIESARVVAESPVSGASPIALRFRSETGALVVGTRRGDELLDEPDPSLPFEPGDIVYFVGTRDALERALRLFDPRSRRDEDEDEDEDE